MANLTDTGVNGDLRVTGTIFGTHAGNFAVCSTAGDVAAKTVTLSGFTLAKSVHVYVKFTYANSVANPTLNVSGTGAKNIKYKGANLTNYHTLDGKMYEFVYDGSYWNVVGDLLPLASNTTPGIAKLYDNVTGSNTDGAPSQSAVKSALDGKLSGVSVNGTVGAVTNNVAAIPLAAYDVSTQNDGAMSIADKYTANYYSVSSGQFTTASGSFAACKLAYLSASANLDQNGITGLVSYFNNTSSYALFKFELTVTMKGESCHATMTCLKRKGTFGIPKFYTVKTSSVLAVYVRLESVDAPGSSDYWYVTWGPIPSLKVGASVEKAVTQMVIDPTERDVTSSWDTIANKTEVPTANIQWEAVTSGSSSNAPVKVDEYGKLSAVEVDVSHGGTGKNSVTANSYLKGNGTGALVERTYAEVRTDLGISATTTSVTVGSTTASIPQASSATPKMDSGSGSAGSGTTWAKGDHYHPTDTSREAAANKKSTLDSSSNTDFPTSQAVATYVGTAISSGTVANANNVNVKKATTTTLYLTGVEGDPGTSGSNKALKTDTGIYADTTAGRLVATEFKLNGGCTLQYNSTTNALDFVFPA